ncbi:Hypothetical predicted protein, partial [Pelobates cultripes]
MKRFTLPLISSKRKKKADCLPRGECSFNPKQWQRYNNKHLCSSEDMGGGGGKDRGGAYNPNQSQVILIQRNLIKQKIKHQK